MSDTKYYATGTHGWMCKHRHRMLGQALRCYMRNTGGEIVEGLMLKSIRRTDDKPLTEVERAVIMAEYRLMLANSLPAGD